MFKITGLQGRILEKDTFNSKDGREFFTIGARISGEQYGTAPILQFFLEKVQWEKAELDTDYDCEVELSKGNNNSPALRITFPDLQMPGSGEAPG